MIPRTLPPRQTPPAQEGARRIPRRIHQTFKTRDVSEGMRSAVMTWIEKNPGYSYDFHDDEDARTFIERNFGGEILRAYDRIENGAFRADFWRYCRLFVDGGVYCDVDSICEMPLDRLIGEDDEFLSARAGRLPFAVYNGFLCARPGHPFMEAAIMRSSRLIMKKGRHFDGYVVTGPWNLGVSINAVNGRDEKAEHEIGWNRGGLHDYRLLRKHPKTEGHPGYLSLEGKIVLYTEYEGYRDELASLGVEHWQSARYYRTLRVRLGRFASGVRKRVWSG